MDDFLGALKTPKFHSEINWPLTETCSCVQLYGTYNLCFWSNPLIHINITKLYKNPKFGHVYKLNWPWMKTYWVIYCIEFKCQPEYFSIIDAHSTANSCKHSIYIRTVSSELLLCSCAFVSFLAGLVLGRNQVYCAYCSAQIAHKLVLTGLYIVDNRS